MHSLTKIPELIRKEIFKKYKEKMKITKWKNKEKYYVELATFYRVHYNTIRKIILRWKNWAFTVHKSIIKANQWHKIKEVFKIKKKIEKKLSRDKIVRY